MFAERERAAFKIISLYIGLSMPMLPRWYGGGSRWGERGKRRESRADRLVKSSLPHCLRHHRWVCLLHFSRVAAGVARAGSRSEHLSIATLGFASTCGARVVLLCMCVGETAGCARVRNVYRVSSNVFTEYSGIYED